MSKYEIVATHPVTFLFSVEAPSRAEAERIVMENEHQQAEQIEEGNRGIIITRKVSKFHWEK